MRTKPLANVWQQKWIDLEVTNESIQEMADKVEQWASRFFRRKESRHILICGFSGTGKTHTAKKIYHWAGRLSIFSWDSDFFPRQTRGFWPKPPRVEWFEFAEIAFLPASEFKSWLADRDPCDCLFLEDVGAEVDAFKSGEPTERFREILNAFKNKFLFMTTNIPPQNWKSKWDFRIEDRLYRDSVIVNLDGVKSFIVTK